MEKGQEMAVAAQVGAKAVEQKVPAAGATATAETTAVVAASTEMALVAASAGYVKLCAVVAAEAATLVCRLALTAEAVAVRQRHLQRTLSSAACLECTALAARARAPAASPTRWARLAAA